MASLFFMTTCSNCLRQQNVEIKKLGRQIPCAHCQQPFTATDPHNESAAVDDPVNYWVRYTDLESRNRPFELPGQRDSWRNPR